MSSLTALDISYNDISNISPKLQALQNLTSLSVAGNTQVVELPDFPRLRVLDISSSGIVPFPAGMALSALTELHADSLRLTTVPSAIISHASLEVLTLANNELTQLPPDIRALKALRQLNLSGNPLQSLPPEIGELSSLQTLIISKKKKKNIAQHIAQHIKAHIYCWPSRNVFVFCLFIYLFVLMSDNTNVETFPAEFGRLATLERLEMNSARVTDINIDFSQMAHMKVLLARKGHIKSFTPESARTVRRLAALEELDLCSNELAAVPGGFGFLPRLTKIDLSHNAIERVPGDFYFLNPVVQLNLDGNTLYEPFHEWYTMDGLSTLLRNLAPYCTAIPENCSIEPEPLKQVSVNAPVELTVRARDFKGNPRTTGKEPFAIAIAAPDGATPVDAIIRDNDGKEGKSGTYSCYFRISDPGQYKVSITLNGEHIKGSPWSLQAVSDGDDDDDEDC